MELLAASEIPAAPVLIVMAIGVLVAMFGHASKMKNLVVIGLLMLFMATAAMLVGGYIAYNADEADPREERDPGGFSSPSFGQVCLHSGRGSCGSSLYAE